MSKAWKKWARHGKMSNAWENEIEMYGMRKCREPYARYWLSSGNILQFIFRSYVCANVECRFMYVFECVVIGKKAVVILPLWRTQRNNGMRFKNESNYKMPQGKYKIHIYWNFIKLFVKIFLSYIYIYIRNEF